MSMGQRTLSLGATVCETGGRMELPADVLASVADAVGEVDGTGALHARNGAMRELLAQLAVAGLDDLVRLAGEHGDAEAFARGEAVLLAAGRSRWRARCVTTPSGRWVVARDVAVEDTLAGFRAATARSRQLGDLASALLHDLCNQLNSAVALAALVRPFLRDAPDQKLLDDLANGSRHGVDMLRAVVRLLPRARAPREHVDLRTLLTDTGATMGKALRLQGGELEVRGGTAPLDARTHPAEVAQVLLAAVGTLLDCGATGIVASGEVDEHRCGGGRPRRAARLRLAGAVPSPVVAAAGMHELVSTGRGLLTACTPTGRPLEGFARAVLVLAVLGGDTEVTAVGDELRIDYWLPLVGTSAS